MSTHTIKWKEDENGLIIFTPDEFSFLENLRYLSRSANECLYEISHQKIRRALSIKNEKPLLEISAVSDKLLYVQFLGDHEPVTYQAKASIAAYIHDWFDLGTSLIPFYEMARTDLLLHKLANQFFGLRILGIPDLFEALAWGILGQQINLTYAYTLKRRLVEKYGDYLEYDGTKYWLFPAAETIAGLMVEDLADLKMTVKKCEYLIDVARLIANGELSKEDLLNEGDVKSAEKRLTRIRGIGPWTAHYVLMRCLRFPSAFPIDDVGLHNSIKLILGSEKKPTKEEILKYSGAWKNWESYATFYLWRVLY
ncbi:DNA-3-methyladenine glycosidase II [Aeromicrobium ponti]|uniref:DNA-3-methyladenine glycosylase II n=1 Tax=Cytobacillus oceanisediminis TaxID=665099 RepID=A0A562JWJ8_9BACI|nr:DNA-3-methyladenine glycosylase [Cytobacillus oceanisediminis]TWH87551.1 DNA-3-methyladenine glycosylase II [Cytobacillus oceanisediminis]